MEANACLKVQSNSGGRRLTTLSRGKKCFEDMEFVCADGKRQWEWKQRLRMQERKAGPYRKAPEAEGKRWVRSPGSGPRGNEGVKCAHTDVFIGVDQKVRKVLPGAVLYLRGQKYGNLLVMGGEGAGAEGLRGEGLAEEQ